MWNWGVHPEQNDAVAGRSSKQFEANEQRCSKSEKCISFVGTFDSLSEYAWMRILLAHTHTHSHVVIYIYIYSRI